MPDAPGNQSLILKTHFIKSNFFRVVHADGAWGGITPQGNIQMELWSERQPIPTLAVYPVADDGTIGDESVHQREIKEGTVREVEVGVVLNLFTAKSLIKWLQERVDFLEGMAQLNKPEEGR